jgi:hypothetical protein
MRIGAGGEESSVAVSSVAVFALPMTWCGAWTAHGQRRSGVAYAVDRMCRSEGPVLRGRGPVIQPVERWVVGSRTPLAHPLASVVGLQFVVCCLHPTTRSLLSGTGSLGVVCLSYLTQPTNN